MLQLPDPTTISWSTSCNSHPLPDVSSKYACICFLVAAGACGCMTAWWWTFITPSKNLKRLKLEQDSYLLHAFVILYVDAGAEKVIGWARSHYLSSAINPSIKGDKLVIPRERYFLSCLGIQLYLWAMAGHWLLISFLWSLDLAIERLRELEASTKSVSENMKVI